MRHFLSTTDVAEFLGVSVNVVNARVRAGEFPEPDAVIGGHFQGWARETIEKLQCDGEGGKIFVDGELLMQVVNEIRTVAETVRTYGAVGASNPGISVSTPAALHVLAARIESEMRGWARVEHSVSRRFSGSRGPETIEFPGLRVVDSAATPEPLGVDVQVAELRAAAARLDSATEDFRRGLASKTSRKLASLLAAEVSAITTFAYALE